MADLRAKASRVLLCLVAASVLLALLPCAVHSADSANVSAEEAGSAAAAESARATAEAVAKAAESAAAKDEAAEKAAEEAATAREGDKGAEEEAQSPIPPAIAQAERRHPTLSLSLSPLPRPSCAAAPATPGACKKEIAEFCGDLTVGNRTVERCLTGQVQLLKSKGGQGAPLGGQGEVGGRRGARREGRGGRWGVRAGCCEGIVREWDGGRGEEAGDIQQYCNDGFLYPEPGNVLACLRCTEPACLPQVSCSLACLRYPLRLHAPGIMLAGIRCKRPRARCHSRCAMPSQRLPFSHRPLLCPPISTSPQHPSLIRPSPLPPCTLPPSRRSQGDAGAGKLSDGCGEAVLEAEEDAAGDFRMDPQLHALCSNDAARLCKDVAPGEGRVQDCLRQHRSSVNWDCQAELFRQEVENADDIRLNVRLFKACLEDKRRFCADVVPGDARVKDCLEAHRRDSDFSTPCKEEVERMMEHRASDFRLDPGLRKYCHRDIVETCYPDADDISDVASWDSRVIECLQDYRRELKDPRCRQQVHLLTQRAAEDMRFDHPLQQACQEDREVVCAGVPDGNARVFMCLQENRQKLKPVCRTALFEQEIRYAEDIDFKFPMRQACQDELLRLCKDQHGGGDTIACLQKHEEDEDMGEQCKKEVKKDEERSAHDFRLNYKLNRACFSDVQRLCMHSCEPRNDSFTAAAAPSGDQCGGRVLQCLAANASLISSPECREEVAYFERREVGDIMLDVPLQRACVDDIGALCGLQRDHSKVLSCLRQHRAQLKPECRDEELRFSAMEASDIRLTPSLMNACGLELHAFCRGVPPSEGKAFRCLQTSLGQESMGVACRSEVALQTVRESQFYLADVALALQCQVDIAKTCSAAANSTADGDGEVIACLVQHYDGLSGKCQTEVAYLVRMALWVYHPANNLTMPCAADVAALCPNATSTSSALHAAAGVVVAAVGQCLVDQPLAKLSSESCRQLVAVVGVAGAHVGGVVDEARLEATLAEIAQVMRLVQVTLVQVAQIAQLLVLSFLPHCPTSPLLPTFAPSSLLHARTCISPVLPNALNVQLGALEQQQQQGEAGSVVLTGWTALLAVLALSMLLIGAGIYAHHHFFSPTRDYSLVVQEGGVKEGDV
ncbi:unnamed protein product [Closterium sp. NIES-64]|nr:unnamed protein product [Closterium sp. NIES-64]